MRRLALVFTALAACKGDHAPPAPAYDPHAAIAALRVATAATASHAPVPAFARATLRD